MKSKWLLCCCILFLAASTQMVMAQGDVTFQVNMKIKMLEGTFLPDSGDIVRVAGSFNNWGSSTDTLTDGDVDSIYTKTITLPVGPIEYKFLKTLRFGDWENVPNRQYVVVPGPQTLPVEYFDNDSVANSQVGVTFQVNMKVKILEGTFRPDFNDIVRVAGSFNDWGNSTDTLTDGNSDSIYVKTIALLEESAIQYKYLKTPRFGDWEDPMPNRQYTVPFGGGPIPVVYFANDSIADAVSADFLWNVNMTTYLNLGWFLPNQGDSMEVRGPFNGWSSGPSARMDASPLDPTSYELLLPYVGAPNEDVPYKYFMDLDSAGASVRFPGWANNRDGMNYEHPAERGDGNRLQNMGNGGNITPPPFYFSSISPNGVINGGDSVTVTVRMNMGPATRDVGSPGGVFVPGGEDTVRLIWQDDLSVGAQRAIQGSFSDITLSPVSGPTDTFYQGTFTYVGPAHYNFMYTYRYIHPNGSQGNEGGGLGIQNPYRSRFVIPNAPNSFPRYYNAPLDEQQRVAPMPVENPPFNPTTDVLEDPNGGVPSAYKLLQNFPNPFNPSTRIRYTIPERAKVSLKVFNVLGQEVATLVNEEQTVGNYVALFEANKLATGVYFYRLQAGSFTQVKKMLLLK